MQNYVPLKYSRPRTCGPPRIIKTHCAHVPGAAVSAFCGLLPLILKTALESCAYFTDENSEP